MRKALKALSDVRSGRPRGGCYALCIVVALERGVEVPDPKIKITN